MPGKVLFTSYSEMGHLITLFGSNTVTFLQIGAVMSRWQMFLLRSFDYWSSFVSCG